MESLSGKSQKELIAISNGTGKLAKGACDNLFNSGMTKEIAKQIKSQNKDVRRRIEDFLAEWGKSTDLLCNELAYDKEDCDDFLKIDYFWYPFFNNGCWLPIEDGEYDDEAQMIANYLRSTIVS